MRLLQVALLVAVLAALALVFWPEPDDSLVLPCAPPTQSAPQFPRSPDLFSHHPAPKLA